MADESEDNVAAFQAWCQRMAVASELASGNRVLIRDAEDENELVEVVCFAEPRELPGPCGKTGCGTLFACFRACCPARKELER